MIENKVYYRGVVVFDKLNQIQLNHLIDSGYISKEQKNVYVLLERPELKHLFDPKIPAYKKKDYFYHLNKQRLVCEDCGEQYSFHIRPVIEEDGSVNFKKIVCVCKSCRFKTLKKKDILVPQFKQEKTETEEDMLFKIKRETYSAYSMEFAKKLLSIPHYIKLYKEEKKVLNLLRIPLPPLYENEMRKKVREGMELVISEVLGDNVDLSDAGSRLEVKRFLLGESYGTCPCCGEYMTPETLTIDHIIAKSNGGTNNIKNFIGLCESCNKDKDKESILEFLRRKSFSLLPTRILMQSYLEKQKLEQRLEIIRNEIERFILQEQVKEELKTKRLDSKTYNA